MVDNMFNEQASIELVHLLAGRHTELADDFLDLLLERVRHGDLLFIRS